MRSQKHSALRRGFTIAMPICPFAEKYAHSKDVINLLIDKFNPN